jgi:hypothetical protein
MLENICLWFDKKSPILRSNTFFLSLSHFLSLSLSLIFFLGGSTEYWTHGPLNLLGRHSTTWFTHSALFTLLISGNKVLCFHLKCPRRRTSYLCFLHSWNDRCTQVHTASYWLRWDLTNFLPGLTSKCDPPDLCLLCSWDYITDMIHHNLLIATCRSINLCFKFLLQSELL